MRKKTEKIKRSMVFLLVSPNVLFLILAVSLQKISVIVPVRNDSTVWAKSTTRSSPFDSRTEAMSFASMVPGTGEKGERFMKTKIKYTVEPMGEPKIVRDFLPPPEQLALKEEKVKITISFSKSSLDFFKREAKRNRTSYQKMIRGVVDFYASHYQKGA